MGFSSKRREAEMADAEGAAAEATNQLDTESRDEPTLVSAASKNLALLIPTVSRGM